MKKHVSKVIDKEAEIVEAFGQEDEKTAIKDTTTILKAQEKEHEEREAMLGDVVHKARLGPVKTYIKTLATLLEGKMMTVERPPGWDYIVYPTDEGIILELNYQTPLGYRMFRSAFKPTMIEMYDMNAVNTYVIRAENTIDRVMHTDASSPIAKSPAGEN